MPPPNETRSEQTCIFVSYSSKDREAAEDIEARLQRAGIRVWRDKTRLDADWSREIAEALANEADALCLLWSKDAADSRWVKHEWLTARALEKRIFPCRLNGAPVLPSALASLDAIEYSAVSRLVDRIQAAETFHHRYDYTLLPPHTFIPLNPNPEFQGRQPDLLNLYLCMVGNLNKIGINQAGVGGMGGIGKTQLVVEFAYRFSFAFDHIFWLEAADEQRWLEQFVEIARDRLGLRIDNPDGPVTSRQYLLQLQKHCKENPQTLIVMDNVPEPRQLNSARVLEGLAPLVLGANLLFTTRRRFKLPGVLEQSVYILPPEAAYALLTSARAPLEAGEQQAAKSICDTVGRLPLALALIHAYLKDQSMEYSEYLRHLRTRGLGAIDLGEVSAEELATRHKAAVGETLAEDWHVVGDDTALLLCRLAAQFPETAIVPKARLGLLAGLDETDDLFDPLRKAFSRLRDLHLVEIVMGGDAVSLHPLVRDFVLGLTPADQQHAMRADAAERLFEKLLERDRFERHVRDRGIDAVIHDVETAMTWAPDLEEARGLYRILDRERYPIRRGAPLFQQLHHRAFNMGMLDFAERFADAAHAAGRPFFRSVTTTQVEDPAWIRSFEGHSSGVTDACFSPDGRRALSGSTDNTLILWDVESGQALRSFEGHADWSRLGSQEQRHPSRGWIKRVRFSPDGRYALSVSKDQTLIVWDGESGQALHALTGPSSAEHSACFSPDSRRALCGLEDGALVYWDLASRQTVRLQTKATWLGAACSSPHGARALSWDKKALFLWDLDSGELLRSFEEHPAEIGGACLSADGRRALSFSESAAVLWDLESGRAVRTFDGSAGETVCLSPDGRRVLSNWGSPIMLLIDLEAEETLGAFDGHSGSVTSICFSPDGRHALSCSEDKTLILWNLESDQSPRSGSRHSARVTSLCLSHDGRRALSGSRDQTLVLWDVKSGQRLRSFEGPVAYVAGVALSPDGRFAVSGSWNKRVVLWDVETEQHIRFHEHHSEQVNCVCFSPDGRRVMSGSEDETMILWELEGEDGEHLFVRGHADDVTSVSFSPDGRRVLSSSRDRTIGILDLDSQTGRRLWGHSDVVWTACFSPDGRRALSGSWDKTLKLWDLESGQVLRPLNGHTGRVTSARFSPDGRFALSGSEDRTIVLWDLESGDVVTRLHTKADVTAIDWRESTIAYGEESGVVYFLELDR